MSAPASPTPGPAVRTDLVDVHVFRRPSPRSVEFLQLRRRVPPLAGSWQPVMGHVEPGESAVAAARRELREETGWHGPVLRGFWQLESVNAFFLASLDAVVLSPCFAAEVAADAQPTLDAAHDAVRWVGRDHADRCFLWPGQRQAIEQIVRDLLDPQSPVAAVLRLPDEPIGSS